VVPIGLGFDMTQQPPRGARGAAGKDGQSGRDGRSFFAFSKDLDSGLFSAFSTRRSLKKEGRSFVLTEAPLFLPAKGDRGRPGPFQTLFVKDEPITFVRRETRNNFWQYLSKQDTFYSVRAKNVLPQPVLLQRLDFHQSVKNVKTSKTLNLVQRHDWQRLTKTVQKKFVQQVLPQNHQTYVRQQRTLVQKSALARFDNYTIVQRRFFSQRKTDLLQRFEHRTVQISKTQNKTIHRYDAPQHYHFVLNYSRLERALARNSNSLIFTGGSSLILSGDAGVVIV
jgi:hypothetical protein